MRRVWAFLFTMVIILACSNCFTEEVKAVIGETYEFDKVSSKLVAYHVEEIGGIHYLYVDYEFINNGTSTLTFENAAWLIVTQDDEECYIHSLELPDINLIKACKPGDKARYTNAYQLHNLTSEVVIDMFPTDQLLAGWGNRKEEVFYYIDIASEPKAITDGYEWEALYK